MGKELIAFVDPGAGTGLVIFSIDDKTTVPDKVLHIGTTVPEGAIRLLEFAKPWITVFEEMPEVRNIPTSIETLYGRLSSGSLGKTTFRVSPSMWKPFAKANEWKVDLKTPHERDVLNMARWWFLVRYNIGIEDIKYEDRYLWKRT